MHRFTGFPDLRQNRAASGGEAEFWPSFTDIMTVILMVFMLTMVVVIKASKRNATADEFFTGGRGFDARRVTVTAQPYQR